MKDKNKIKENKIRCKTCNEVIESMNNYKRVMCSCGKVGVDGGKIFLKRTGSPKDYEELSVLE